MAYSPGGGNDARLPMPVRWIYVLRDGSLTTPVGIGTGKNGNIQASFSGATNPPTKKNPIVGRVAFWTDDDTSKLNVNVAGGSFFDPNNPPNNYTASQYAGSFWDTPRVNSVFDQGTVYGPGIGGYVPGASGNGGSPIPNGAGLASVQMIQNEFQRYPGHPATTSMANVFKTVLTSEQLYQITPRIHKGTDTTVGGTNRLHIQTIPGASTNNLVENVGLPIRYDRLYDSVDEMLYAYQTNHNTVPKIRQTNANALALKNLTDAGATFTPYTGGASGTANDVTQYTPGLLDRLRFFLTAYNRSPELNLFGHPRISVWPIRSQTWSDDIDPTKSGLNAYDNLSLFCSTIGPAVFNYKLANSQSQGANAPYHYSFFRTEASQPDLSKVTLDINLPRNQDLMKYLHALTQQSIPGFGGQDFATKYTAKDMDQTLVEMFDYIRCANLYDSSITNTGASPANPHPFAKKGIVMPSVGNLDGNTQRGMGRFPTICEATIVFYYAGSDLTVKGIYPPQAIASTSTVKQFNEGSGVLVITPPDSPWPNDTKKVSQIPKLRYMRAALLLSTFNPMQGYGPISAPAPATEPVITFDVSGLDSLKITGASALSPTTAVFGGATGGKITLNGVSGSYWGGRNFGGFEGFAHTLNVGSAYPLMGPATAMMALDVKSPVQPPAAGPFTGDYQEPGGPPTFNMQSGTVSVTVSYGNVPLQTIQLKFPACTLPAPRGDDIVDAEPFAVDSKTGKAFPVNNAQPVLANTLTPQDGNAATGSNGQQSFTEGGPQPYGQLRRWYWSQDLGSFDPNGARTVPTRAGLPASWLYPVTNTPPINTGTEARTLATARDFQARINYVLNQNGSDSTSPATSSPTGPVVAWRGGKWRQLIQPGDTVRSLIFCDPPTNGTASTPSGDMRLAAVTNSVAAPALGSGLTGFYQHPDYLTPTMQQACLLRMADGNLYYNYNSDLYFSKNASSTTGLGSFGLSNTSYSLFNPFGNHVALTATNSAAGKQFPQNFAVANLPRMLSQGSTPVWTNGVTRHDGTAGDFDTGVGAYPDGSYFNKQDEGNAIFARLNTQTGVIDYPIPYFGNGAYSVPGSAFNSPNRQMPSPAMMGSLLSRAASGYGWETLCFCPSPAGASNTVTPFGNTGTKDHLLLDLFEMPVVQPYPISEPFSTAGKVNMNFQIQPFDYIERSTALRAVLASERVTIFGVGDKSGVGTNGANLMYLQYKDQSVQMPTNVRYPIDRALTMGIFREWLANPSNGGIFRSPSQICEIYLISTKSNGAVTTAKQAAADWVNADLTGDNVREKPYADLFPRLTTKSNTYTIHMKVQSLRQNLHGTDQQYLTWDESTDFVLGEYRGSSSVERYIDPSDRHFNPLDPLTQSKGDAALPDDPSGKTSLEAYYRFRTVNTKLFAP